MKKQLFLAAIALGSIVFGQNNTFPVSGYVGIGTTSPSAKLHVIGHAKFNPSLLQQTAGVFINPDDGSIELASGVNTLSYIDFKGKNNLSSDFKGRISYTDDWGFSFSKPGTNQVVIKDNGNMGIGTEAPLHRLHVLGYAASFNDPAVPLAGIKLETIGAIEIASSVGPLSYIDFKGSANLTSDFRGRFGYSDGFGFSFDRAGKYNLLVIKENDNVGIGTANPDEKLTVKGKIHAEEIKVDLAVPADYVFQKYFTGSSTLKPDYQMPSLNEIESFVKENHHLPNIPSASEIQQNGLQLGEMNNLLLQKVEELTLYIIEQNKRIEALEAKVTENN